MKFKLEWTVLPPKLPEVKGEQDLPSAKELARYFEQKTGAPRLSRFDPRLAPQENFRRVSVSTKRHC